MKCLEKSERPKGDGWLPGTVGWGQELTVSRHRDLIGTMEISVLKESGQWLHNLANLLKCFTHIHMHIRMA